MHSFFCVVSCFAFLFIVCTTAATSRCNSDDQFPINCSCFVVKSSTNSLTWNESMERCSKDSATLASIKSTHENDILGDHLNSNNSWIGLKAEVNSSFLLPGGEKAPFVISKVGKTFNTNTQTCIAIRSTNIWRARNCDEVHGYICVYKESLRRKSSCPRGPGWKQSSNSCFYLSKEKETFSAATNNCTRLGANLAETFTKNEYKFVREELYNGIDSIDVWLGLRKDINDTKYKYLSGKSEPQYRSLGAEFIQPTTIDPQSKYCVTMQLDKYKATWEAKQCGSKLRSYVCETEIKRDYKVNVTNVNETSANISWSIHPPQCGIPKDSFIKLNDGSKVHEIINISGNQWKVVKNLKPERNYEIVITSKKVKKFKTKFETIKIRNPLRLLEHSSSSNTHAVLSDTVNLLCAAKGEPPITYSWQKDNQGIQSYVEIEKPSRSSILSVQLINQTSYGQYLCHIQDRFSNMTYTVTIQSIPDDSEGNQKIFVILIVILAITVVVLVIIIAYFIRYVKQLKQNLTKTEEVDVVTMKNLSDVGQSCEKSQDSKPTTKPADDLSVEDENASYTALKRNCQDDEEDHYYSALKEAPLYVNASEFKQTT